MAKSRSPLREDDYQCTVTNNTNPGCSVPAPNNPLDILMPGGNPVGLPGSRPAIRELPGGYAEAKQMFDELSQSGTPNTPPNYSGTGTTLAGGGWVGLRPASKSG